MRRDFLKRIALLLLAICPYLRQSFGTESSISGPLGHPVQFRTGNTLVEGLILAWTDRDIILLRRDGALQTIARASARDFATSPVRFTPLTGDAIRSQLQAEFGRGYEVSLSPRYVVVKPAGRKEPHSEWLEALFRDAWKFATQRRLPVREPAFPLVFVIYKSREEFEQSAEFQKSHLRRSSLRGLYDPQSNRCVTYMPAGPAHFQNSTVSEMRAIIRHEAFHQFAANTGLQGRTCETPLWLAEGLAMMFERGAPGSPQLVKDQSSDFTKTVSEQILARTPPGWLNQLIASDAFFEAEGPRGYFLSWATVTYLSERRLTQFVGYLRKLQARPPFRGYIPQDRLSDFQESFGTSWEILERDIRRHVQTF